MGGVRRHVAALVVGVDCLQAAGGRQARRGLCAAGGKRLTTTTRRSGAHGDTRCRCYGQAGWGWRRSAGQPHLVQAHHFQAPLIRVPCSRGWMRGRGGEKRKSWAGHSRAGKSIQSQVGACAALALGGRPHASSAAAPACPPGAPIMYARLAPQSSLGSASISLPPLYVFLRAGRRTAGKMRARARLRASASRLAAAAFS